MLTHEEAIRYAMSLPDVYIDRPFGDQYGDVLRIGQNRKIFLGAFMLHGQPVLNLKADPQWCLFWRDAYPAVIPGYHMNKEHWNSIILDGSIPDEDIHKMIDDSYRLVRKKPMK